ncbi:MAG: heavy metal-associated domain-containing protein [Candidatus Micrarchaeota archaeon]|nr:heavy metal-associated domain-containing protein [Candidatus Micrarchaeota archaeon]
MNVLNVKGMHCKSCELLLSEDLSAISGVSNVSANHQTGKVAFDGPVSSIEPAKAAIRTLGYQVD